MKHPYKNIYPTIRIEGGLIPSDFIEKIARGDRSVEGLTPEDYHLASGERTGAAATKSWNRLISAWRGFKQACAKLSGTEAGTSVTRDRWLLILFQELGYGRLIPSKSVELGSKTYPVSHFWGTCPIHLVGCNIRLDRRTPGVAGAARASPHGMIQEFLNKSGEHLWAFVSNGLLFRILRDNASLTRQAYVEFDLQTMMEGELYPDFYLLWLICHQSRVEGEMTEECWLEKWMRSAREKGARALEHLRTGVEEAIKKLGKGFLTHPSNTSLRTGLMSGNIAGQDFYRELLRLVYRFIFLFVAEERGLLFASGANHTTREFYSSYYSLSRIRNLAGKKRGTRHADLFQGIKVVMKMLGTMEGCPVLGLPALGSFLWSERAIPALAGCELANSFFLDAIRSLTLMEEERMLRRIDYSRLGTEELGSIYESLLELHPVMDASCAAFDLHVSGGHERKTTGSYYTPVELIRSLLDSAVEPVLDEAMKSNDPEKAILALKIVDPACGSGHFLIAASHRIALRLASVRTGEEEASPEAVRTALRDVISHCIYGVDMNPMAVELCKVALWMEALEPGKPLSFLDHRIRCGNSLLGATPALIDRGIPDEAFNPIEGDDKKICSQFKKRNNEEHKLENDRAQDLFHKEDMPWDRLGNIAATILNLGSIEDDTIEGVEEKQKRFEEYVSSSRYLFSHLLADTYCASFVWKKVQTKQLPYPITERLFRDIEKNPYACPPWMGEKIRQIAKDYRFFHWYLEFPDVFYIPPGNEQPDNEETGWSGGFDVVLGNPPWERIKLQEKEWFAEKRPDITLAQNASSRKKMIENLKDDDPALYEMFVEDRRKAEGESMMIRQAGNYPLCGRGDINTYAVFAELNKNLVNAAGRVGCIVPSGIASDDTTKFYFQEIMEKRRLISLYDFENREGIFPGVHRSYKFCLLTLTGKKRPSDKADFMFFAHRYDDLADDYRHFTLSDKEIRLLNPNTRTCPVFRTKRDAELTKAVYQKVPVLIQEEEKEGNPWGISFMRMFDMSNDSGLFHTQSKCEQDGYILEGNVFRKGNQRRLPLYEAKLIHHYDQRWATYEGSDTRAVSLDEKKNPNFFVLPRYWVDEAEVDRKLGDNKRDWFVTQRAIADMNNERRCICCILPYSGVGNSAIVHYTLIQSKSLMLNYYANYFPMLIDYLIRIKAQNPNMNQFILKQLPILSPQSYESLAPFDREKPLAEWLSSRVLELTYTAYDLEPFARDCGYTGPPFAWDEERRFFIRCEIDAAFFHLYGISREDVSYVMDTFPIVRRKDEQQYNGSYRTKETILKLYDEMAESIRTGKNYTTSLVPGPGER